MDASSTFMSKKMSDLTVGDSVKVSAIAPIMTVVVTVGLPALGAGLKKGFVALKNRKNTTDVQPTES